MNADYVIAFSPQFELRNKWAMDVNPYLKKYELDSKRNSYYDLKPILNKSETPIYYIVPIKSETDKYHYDYIKNVPCIKPIIFNSKRHGIVMLKKNVIQLLSLSKEEINKIYEYNRGKVVSDLTFSFQLVGLKVTFISVVEELIMYLKLLVKKIKEC